MDALSTPAVSGLRLGGGGFLPTAPRDHQPHLLLKRPPPPSTTTTNCYPHLIPNTHHRAPPPSSSIPATRSLRSSSSSSLPNPSPIPRRQNLAAVVHRRAATGYAAALLDAARCRDSVDAVENDVRRLASAVRSLDLNGGGGGDEKDKGEAVRRVVERGGFCGHLVALVRMLVGKGRVGMVGEVMEEFERIYDELMGVRRRRRRMVVENSPEEEEDVAEIAGRVRRMSGAPKMRVRRHVVRRSSSPVLFAA